MSTELKSSRKIRNTTAILAVVFVSFMTGSRSDVIYGADTRQNISDIGSEKLRKIARSTLAMIYTKKLKRVGDSQFQVSGLSHRSKNKLCAEERFSDEPVVVDCSGFLIAPDVVVTAGHCLKSQKDCKKISWVFGLDDRVILNSNTVEFDRKDVYTCSRILKFDPHEMDVAVIRLDREVRNASPLRFRSAGSPLVGDQVAIFGNPGQLTTKVATGGRVREVYADSFIAEVSACYGSSGSAVVNERTGLVEGLLVDGESDWTWDSSKKCNRSKVCKRGECSGETVVRIQDALKGVVF